MGKLSFAMVCSSNQNRSMEAQALLKANGFQVESFGTGGRVKLPGETEKTPNVYNFGTSYQAMLEDLRTKSESFYRKRGLLQLLERNAAIKAAPEQWQSSHLSLNFLKCRLRFDVAVTFEERVMDALLEDVRSRDAGVRPLLVVNMDVSDNQEEAAKASQSVLGLCTQLEGTDDLLGQMDDIIQAFQIAAKKRVLYDVCFY